MVSSSQGRAFGDKRTLTVEAGRFHFADKDPSEELKEMQNVNCLKVSQ